MRKQNEPSLEDERDALLDEVARLQQQIIRARQVVAAATCSINSIE
ncbi:hypothetical protein GPZ83_0006400 [Serratia symbiotica]|uniref:Uncharacterized protein n=1 Tax=Serratia symbiotica TaxID=138074 RepID=A0A7D5SN89_9GAMM|nr:hypothetical protein [Serratia symbiotica]QLH62793.1 hypothetical protein SYMBAF_07355 [Serratia symbiotica]QTP15506.1 hypothetical protein GPZ83_0006400 [Serratia symbiotica]